MKITLDISSCKECLYYREDSGNQSYCNNAKHYFIMNQKWFPSFCPFAEFKGIAISGKAHSGKSYLSQYIFKNSKVSFSICKFADPMYFYISQFEQNKKREFLTQLGDLTKHHYGDDIFVKHMEKRILKKHSGTLILIDDLRYYSEFEMLKKNSFYVIYLDIPEAVRKQRCQESELEWIPNHSSETEMESFKDKCDWIINEVMDYDYNKFPSELKRIMGVE